MLPTRSGKLVIIREVEADDLDLVWEWENDSEMGLYLNADPGKRVQVAITKTGDKIDGILFKIPVTLTSQATAKFEQ